MPHGLRTARLDRASAAVFEGDAPRDRWAQPEWLAQSELAALRARNVKMAGVEAERAGAKQDLEAAEKSIGALDDEIAAIAPAAPPQGRDPVAFIEAWRIRRNAALTLVEALRGWEDAQRRAVDEGSGRAGA